MELKKAQELINNCPDNYYIFEVLTNKKNKGYAIGYIETNALGQESIKYTNTKGFDGMIVEVLDKAKKGFSFAKTKETKAEEREEEKEAIRIAEEREESLRAEPFNHMNVFEETEETFETLNKLSNNTIYKMLTDRGELPKDIQPLSKEKRILLLLDLNKK